MGAGRSVDRAAASALDVARRKAGGAVLMTRSRSQDPIVIDLFCGAGSLSAGIQDAMVELGHRPQFVAVNHSEISTRTYARNHPGARVHCVTLDAAFPYEIVPEGRAKLLAAGIECTFFSGARGGKPVTDQQRMSAWHVARWCTEIDIGHVLLENVPEFMKWGPVGRRSGRPIKRREGEFYRAFMTAMENIGHPLETRVINCADLGDPTTRVRWFAMSAKGRKIRWPDATHSKGGMHGLPRWRPMRDCIDWSMEGGSIFDRDRPLAPKTLQRIWAGIVKFGWATPFLVVLRQHCDARGIDLPMPAACAGGTHIGLAQPIILKQHFRRDSQSIEEPMPGATTVSRIGLIEPFVLSQASGGAARAVAHPLPAIPCGGAHALIAPYYSSGSGETCSSTEQPLPAATTKARFGLVMPVTHNDGSNRARSIDNPFPTLTTAKRGELALVTPRGLVGRDHDIRFRMLQPHELAAAMSISSAERPYHFEGNKTQVVRQIGQAVPRRTGYELARALMQVRV
jgi:DNA (cytosine-5)-methyltransferase 1